MYSLKEKRHKLLQAGLSSFQVGVKSIEKIGIGEKISVKTVEKIESGEKSRVKTVEKIEKGEKTEEVILHLLEENPRMTMNELADEIKISASAIEKQLSKLKRENRLERIGPDKGGYWQVKR